MPIHSSTGTSQHRNPQIAAEDAVRRAMEGLEGRALFLLLFAGIGYDQAAIARHAWEASGRIPMTGCSGEGGIGKDWSEESPFWVSAMVFSGEGVGFRTGVVEGLEKDSRRVGQTIRRTAITGAERAVFLFLDGISVNATEFHRGLGITSVPVLGGLASDDWLEEGRTWQYRDGHAYRDAASWFSLTGKVHVAWSSQHGCRPFGKESRITRARGTQILEIDGKPAMDYLADLSYLDSDGPGKFPSLNIALIYQLPTALQSRAIHLVLPEVRDGGVPPRTQAELPPGTRIWLARRDPEAIREGLPDLIHTLADRLSGRTPKALLQFECAGRGRVMFPQEQLSANMRSIQQAAPGDPPWSGFYSYGELIPDDGGNACAHYSMLLAALSNP
jgi:hypothetical protein